MRLGGGLCFSQVPLPWASSHDKHGWRSLATSSCHFILGIHYLYPRLSNQPKASHHGQRLPRSNSKKFYQQETAPAEGHSTKSKTRSRQRKRQEATSGGGGPKGQRAKGQREREGEIFLGRCKLRNQDKTQQSKKYFFLENTISRKRLSRRVLYSLSL